MKETNNKRNSSFFVRSKLLADITYRSLVNFICRFHRVLPVYRILWRVQPEKQFQKRRKRIMDARDRIRQRTHKK